MSLAGRPGRALADRAADPVPGQSAALQIGWQRADNIDAGDLHQLADRLYPDLSLGALDSNPTR
jgi:hypothetical protein